ncbi:hypothetical protein GTA26_27980 [Rhodococcus hoagii]|nr:hypothetical protein [Prescottella equi]
MILVDMPSMLLGFMIYLFSQVFLWLLLAGLLALLIPRSRRYVAARRWRFTLLMMVLAVGSVPYVESSYRQWQDWRAHHPGWSNKSCWVSWYYRPARWSTWQTCNPTTICRVTPFPMACRVFAVQISTERLAP